MLWHYKSYEFTVAHYNVTMLVVHYHYYHDVTTEFGDAALLHCGGTGEHSVKTMEHCDVTVSRYDSKMELCPKL